MTLDLIGPVPEPSGSGIALFLSPHLDDVAFSCGGTAARMARLGWKVVVATAFTRSVPDPTGFALACQLDKGLSADVDYMALRRAEDEAFARVVGAHEVLWLDHPEAPHRGYASAPELFGGPSPGDDVWHALSENLSSLRDRLQPEYAFVPSGIGRHVDHLQVIRSVRATAGLAPVVLQYRDMPYAIRPGAPSAGVLLSDLFHLAIDIGPSLEAKLRGAACYVSQLAFQFGGRAEMERALEHHAREESRRAGATGHAECFAPFA